MYILLTFRLVMVSYKIYTFINKDKILTLNTLRLRKVKNNIYFTLNIL